LSRPRFGAQEFANYGFEDASINRILENAKMSKGAAYYYFEDKADLLATTVQYCVQRLELIDREHNTSILTALANSVCMLSQRGIFSSERCWF
jgi:AcrR family transcriptional regulator